MVEDCYQITTRKTYYNVQEFSVTEAADESDLNTWLDWLGEDTMNGFTMSFRSELNRCLWPNVFLGTPYMTDARRTAQLAACARALTYSNEQEAMDNMQPYEDSSPEFLGAVEIVGDALKGFTKGTENVDPGSTLLNLWLDYQWIYIVE